MEKRMTIWEEFCEMAERDPQAAIFWLAAKNPLVVHAMIDRLDTNQKEEWSRG